MPDEPPDLENQIIGTFLGNLESSRDISDEVVEVIERNSAEDDFGGRELVADQVLRVKQDDEA